MISDMNNADILLFFVCNMMCDKNFDECNETNKNDILKLGNKKG